MNVREKRNDFRGILSDEKYVSGHDKATWVVTLRSGNPGRVFVAFTVTYNVNWRAKSVYYLIFPYHSIFLPPLLNLSSANLFIYNETMLYFYI